MARDMGKRGRQHRGRDGKQRRKKQPKKAAEHVLHHDRFGPIPFIPATLTLADGTVHAFWDYDPDYLPELPDGAVRGNIRRQAYCCDTPRYFYEDIERTCVQCNRGFVFAAREQKFWYESLQFNFASTAVRCVRCRKRQRSEKALARALQDAVGAVAEKPDDATALLQLAEATAEHVERLGRGDLDRAIAATRKAYRLHPELLEALYWQGRCQDLAGRRARGRAAMRLFLEAAEGRGRLRRMVKAAKRRLAPSVPT